MMIERTIPTEESLTVEFKSDRRPLPDSELILAVVCLANAEGGTLYLGVEDDGSVTGVHPKHADPTTLGAFLANRTVPSVQVRATAISEADHTVVVLEVPRAGHVVATSEGQLQRRRLRADGRPECVPYLPHEFVGRVAMAGATDDTARPVAHASLADLDPLERERLRQLHRRFGGDPALLDATDDDLDAGLGFVTDDGGRRVPTVAGLLVIGREAALRRHVPTHEVMFQVASGMEIRVNEGYRYGLLHVLETLEAHRHVRNEETELQVGLFRVPIPTIAERVFREAVLNAVTHRDYRLLGAVHVQWKDETIEVSNPGGFVEGVTLANLLVTPPRPRNPRLADVFKRLNAVDRFGRGVDRIFAGIIRYGRPMPDYSLSTSQSVTLEMSHGPADVAFTRMIVEAEGTLGKPLSIDALLALALLRKERRCTAADLATVIQRTESAARGVIEQLVEAGLVEGRGEGRTRVYILSEAVYRATAGVEAYRNQRGLDPAERVQKVLAMVEERGVVKRADVAKELRLTDNEASKLLARMTRDGLITRVGERRGAQYRRVGDRSDPQI